MLANPKKGQLVKIWFGKRYAHTMPLHGKIGKIWVVGSGRPRNHGVEVEGKFYVIPCGNLNKIEVQNA